MSIVQFQVNGSTVFDPRHLRDWCIRNGEPIDAFWGVANSLWLPRGMEPTRAFLLMTFDAMQIAGVGQPANSAVTISVFESGSASFVYEHCLFLRATALFAGHFNRASDVDPQPAGQTMYLCEFTDIRGFASSFTHTRQAFNVRTPEGGFFKGTAKQLGKFGRDDNILAGNDAPEDQPKPYSWEEMFKQLWESLPDAFLPDQPPTLPPATTPKIPEKFPPRDEEEQQGQPPADEIPPSYPENYIFQDTSGLHAVARVLHDLNCTLIPPRRSADKFKVRSLAIEYSSIPALDAFLKKDDVIERTIDHNLPLLVGNYLPESITVVFPNRSYGEEDQLCSMDFWRLNSTYRKTFEMTELLPGEIGSKLKPISRTNRIIYASQCFEDRGQDRDGNNVKNQKYIDAIAKRLAKEYVLSALFAEAPDQITFSGMPADIISEETYAVPGQRWSALHLYDHGQGLKTALHRYARQMPPGQQDLFSSSGSRGTGAGLFDSTRPGNAAGSQMSHFPTAEIGAPPSLARPGSSPTVTPYDRWALVDIDIDVPPSGSTIAFITKFRVDYDFTEEDQNNAEGDGLPYLTDVDSNGEDLPETPPGPPDPNAEKEIGLELLSGGDSVGEPLRVFNPWNFTIPEKIRAVIKFHWGLGVWLIMPPASSVLIEEATIHDKDLIKDGSARIKLSGRFNDFLKDKFANVQDRFNWPIKKGKKVMVIHRAYAFWQVLAAERTELDVYAKEQPGEPTMDGGVTFFPPPPCPGSIAQQPLLVDFNPPKTEDGSLFDNLPLVEAEDDMSALGLSSDGKCLVRFDLKECD